jgi:hypothetical protein
MTLSIVDAPTEVLAQILELMADDHDDEEVILEVRRLSGVLQQVSLKIGDVRREHRRRMN